MYFAVSWLEPRLVINTTATEWREMKTGPNDVRWTKYFWAIFLLIFICFVQQVNESPENLKYLWYPELEIYGLETFGRQRVLKEMSGVRIMKNKTINYELGWEYTNNKTEILHSFNLLFIFTPSVYCTTLKLTLHYGQWLVSNLPRQQALMIYLLQGSSDNFL